MTTNIMAHVDEVKRILQEKGFPINKFEFSTENKNYSTLSIGSDKAMVDFRSRVSKAEKVIMYVLDQAPTFYPAIKNGSYFDMVRIILVKE